MDKALGKLVYRLDVIRMKARNADTKAVSCTAELNADVVDGNAHKEINYTIEKTTDEKLYATVYGLRLK